MSKRPYKHISYRTGIATEVLIGDLHFYLVARTRDDLSAAFHRIPDIKAAYNGDLAQRVKISHAPEPKPCHS